MSMMMSQILKFMDFTKTQRSSYLENETFFLQKKKKKNFTKKKKKKKKDPLIHDS